MSRTSVAVLLGFVAVYCSAQGQNRAESRGASTRVEALPQWLEVKLALSAAPPYLRSNAAVYALDPSKGYVLERKGANGFTCSVERTDYLHEDYSNGFIVPECQDAEGSRTVVPVEFDIERLRAEGKLSPANLKNEITRRFGEGVYHEPSRPGIAYVVSPVARLYGDAQTKTTVTVNMPHFMFFSPNLNDRDFGGSPLIGSYPYLINPGPMGYIIQHVGEAEKAKINHDSEDLLKEQACGLEQHWRPVGVDRHDP